MDSQRLIEDQWIAIAGPLAARMSVEEFTTWILPLELYPDGKGNFRLDAPFGVFKKGVERRYGQLIAEVAGRPITIGVKENVGTGAQSALRWQTAFTKPEIERNAVAKLATMTPPTPEGKTFKEFIIGESNRLPYLAVCQFAQKGSNGLIFLQGGSGMGKTHLLLAAHDTLRAAGKVVRYVQGEVCRRSLQTNQRQGAEFEGLLVRAEAVLIDGLQHVAENERAARELLRILQLQTEKGRLVLIASTRQFDEYRPPIREHRLFSDALRVELGPLDGELREDLLKAKSREMGVAMEEVVAKRLAWQLEGSVREVEGLVRRLALATNPAERVALEYGILGVKTVPYLSSGAAPDCALIIEIVAFARGITPEEMLSRDRSRRVAWPRHLAQYLCRKLTPASLPEIGKEFGNRNHTSVLRAVRSVAAFVAEDEEWARIVKQMEQLIGSPTVQQARGHRVQARA